MKSIFISKWLFCTIPNGAHDLKLLPSCPALCEWGAAQSPPQAVVWAPVFSCCVLGAPDSHPHLQSSLSTLSSLSHWYLSHLSHPSLLNELWSHPHLLHWLMWHWDLGPSSQGSADITNTGTWTNHKDKHSQPSEGNMSKSQLASNSLVRCCSPRAARVLYECCVRWPPLRCCLLVLTPWLVQTGFSGTCCTTTGRRRCSRRYVSNSCDPNAIL